MSYRPAKSPIGAAKIGRKTELTLQPLATEVEEGVAVTYTGQLKEASGPNIGQGIPNKTIHFFTQQLDSAGNLMGNPAEVANAITDPAGNYTTTYAWAVIGDYIYQTLYLGD